MKTSAKNYTKKTKQKKKRTDRTQRLLSEIGRAHV